MSWVVQALPLNAHAHWVALQRPLTFLASFVYAALALATSAVFSLLRVEPPSCHCPNAAPRTRPRPGGRPQGLSTPPLAHDPREHASAADDKLAPPSQVASVRPPTARRRSVRRLGEFPFHSLDGVKEAEEEDERSDDERDRERRSPSRSSSDLVPALTPGQSETDTDGASEVESIEDDIRHHGGHGAGVVVKGLAVLTRGLLPKRTPSHSKKGSPASASPTDESRSTLSTSTASSAAQSATRRHPCLSALRSRSATIANPSRPSLPSTLAPIEPRRHASDPRDHPAFSVRAPSSPSDSSASSSPRSSFELDSSATKTRKRAATSLFLRSLSPLSRSPGTSPDHSPPTSPRLASASQASISQTHLSIQRPNNLLRTSSSDSSASSSSAELARKRRGRSPDPARNKALVASGPMSAGTVDLEGGSGLSLQDLLR